MFFNNQCDTLLQLLKSAPGLESCVILRAYPNVKKPTRLQRAVIALSPAQLTAERCGLGEDRYDGVYELNADIYVPQAHGTQVLYTCAKEVLAAAMVMAPDGFRLSPPQADDRLDCHTLCCTLLFRHDLDGIKEQEDGE